MEDFSRTQKGDLKVHASKDESTISGKIKMILNDKYNLFAYKIYNNQCVLVCLVLRFIFYIIFELAIPLCLALAIYKIPWKCK